MYVFLVLSHVGRCLFFQFSGKIGALQVQTFARAVGVPAGRRKELGGCLWLLVSAQTEVHNINNFGPSYRKITADRSKGRLLCGVESAAASVSSAGTRLLCS